jgi:hypothetical protein
VHKPTNIDAYSSQSLRLCRETCLYLATILGDLLVEDLIIVGGLVPSLLIAPDDLPEGVLPHAGTLDVDLGLSLGILDGERYAEIAERLRDAGFTPQTNAAGNPTPQTWAIHAPVGSTVTVDFLMPPSAHHGPTSRIKHLEKDFGAIITPGLDLAFRDSELVTVDGKTILGERASREVLVCGPGAFVVLKALAFQGRGATKDAYDLYYVIRNFGAGVEEVASRIEGLRPDDEVDEALAILRRDFLDPEGLGPKRTVAFTGDENIDVLQQDVVGFVQALLAQLD